MASFSLDDIKAAAEKQYGHTDIELGEGKTLRLVNALRLPKEKRKELMALQDRLSSDDESVEVDQEEELRNALRLVAEDKALVEELITTVGDDLAVLITLFKEYAGETELGEASASES